MPQREVLQAKESAVGGLAFEYERQYLSAYDRTVRACPWLEGLEPDAFFAMRPFHKDARTVVAREAGHKNWSSLLKALDAAEEPYWSQFDSNELTALGQGGSFHFEGTELDRGRVGKCCLWLCLTKSFHLVAEFCEAAAGLEVRASPSLLKRLVEADAPLEAVERALRAGIPEDLPEAALSAFRLAREDLLEVLAQTSPLPEFGPVDRLLRCCTEGDLAMERSLTELDPLLWMRRKDIVWSMAATWAETGRSHALEMAQRAGLYYPKQPPAWRTPLHAASWVGDRNALDVGLDLGCPVNGLDQRNSSSPLGWIVRSLLVAPPETNPFNKPEKLDCAKVLVRRGAIVMPGYLALPYENWLESLAPGI